MGRLPVYLNARTATARSGSTRSRWARCWRRGPLVPALRERFPGHRVFLSTTTVTGNAVAKKSVRGARRPVLRALRLPATRCAARSRSLNPSLLLLVETELWPNLIHEARRRGTRVALVNGRISPRSFPRYQRVRALPGLACSAEVDLFLMQGEAHAERIRAMGAPPERVHVTGNLKFDAVEPRRPARAASRGSCTRRRAARRCGSRAARWRARRSWCSRRSTACASACRRRALAGRAAPPRALRRGAGARRGRGLPLPAPQRPRARRPGATARCCCSTRWASWRRSTPLASVVFVGRQPGAVGRPQHPRARGGRQGRGGRARTWRTSRRSPTQFRSESALVQVGSAGRARARGLGAPARRAAAARARRAGARPRGAQPRRRRAATVDALAPLAGVRRAAGRSARSAASPRSRAEAYRRGCCRGAARGPGRQRGQPERGRQRQDAGRGADRRDAARRGRAGRGPEPRLRRLASAATRSS